MSINLNRKIIRRINSFGLRISNFLKLQYIPVLPVHIDIEPINTCNFACKHCKVTYWGKDKEVLTFNNFKKIIKQFPNLQSVKLQGLGEPLLNKDFSNFIKECRRKGIQIEFFTNGSIYNSKIFDLVNDTEKISVIFSIDAATKEVFEEIRSGSNFNSIISNIREIIKNNEKKYSFWTVVSKQNLAELPKIITLANEIGIPQVSFQIFLSDWKSESVKQYNETIKYDFSLKEFKEIKKEALLLAKKHKVELNIYKGNFLTKTKKCFWPYTSAFIASNGDVVPCCVISDSDVIKMGNVFETPFKDIWNSKSYRDFRRTIKKHSLNDFCKSCYGEEV